MNRILPLAAVLGGLALAGCAGTPTSARPAPSTRPAAASETIDADSATLVIHGMSCPQCSNNVNLQLATIEGVRDVTVDLGSGDVRVALVPGAVTRGQLRAAVARAGYTLREVRVPS